MTWDQLKGVANELRGTVMGRWGNLSDDDFDLNAGRPYTMEEQMAAFERLWV